MKKLIALFIACIMAVSMFSVVAYAEPEAEEEGKSYSIGFVCAALSLEFCSNLANSIETHCQERGWTVSVADYGFDIGEMLTKAENLINSGVDALILFPLAPDVCGPVTEGCEKANIPLITVTSPITTDCTSSILVDYYEVGKMQAERGLELCGDDAKFACFQGPAEQQIFVDHRAGVEDTLNEAGAEIVGYDLTDNELDRGMAVTENWIQGGIDFDCIISSADGPAHGAINALQGAGIDDVIVLSENGDTIGLEDVKAGTLNATVYVPSKLFGQYAVEVTEQILNGEEVEKEFYLPLEWVTAENVDEYLEEE